MTQRELEAIAAVAARRLAREPVARIIGRKEFWGLSLGLNMQTLVPRPETETVVEAALAALDCGGVRTRPLRILDLGTGSGALMLALLSELPATFGIGTDISSEALCCARDNATALGLARRASFVACDYGAALAGPFDLIVSNPPYIAHGDIATLAPEVSAFDPPRALDGGIDGLDGYRAIAADARRLLAPKRLARGGARRRPSRCGDLAHAECRLGARRTAAPRSRGHRPGLGPAPGAMNVPHCRYEKKRLDCGSRPTRFRARNRPEILERID